MPFEEVRQAVRQDTPSRAGTRIRRESVHVPKHVDVVVDLHLSDVYGCLGPAKLLYRHTPGLDRLVHGLQKESFLGVHSMGFNGFDAEEVGIK